MLISQAIMPVVGIALWIAAGVFAFFLARIIPYGSAPRWWPELVTAIVTGGLAGLGATVADFGGWRELDWRAGLFAFFCALGAIGVVRATLLALWKKVP